jgi:tetratricopeptide (TPR) repeat protein
MRFLAVLLLAGCATAPLSSRAAKWDLDLRFLEDELTVRHANAFHTISREELARGFDALRARAAHLPDDQIVLELSRLITRIGDGHTALFIPWARGLNWRRLPIMLYPAKDGWVVLAATPEHASLVGARVSRIGDTDIETVIAAIEPLVPRDNLHGVRNSAAIYVVVPELLAALRFVSDPDAVRLTTDAGEVTLKPVPRETRFETHTVPALKRRAEKYWSEVLPDGTLFVQFNSADIATGEPEAQFEEFTRTIQADRIIVDLRWNNGGSLLRAQHLLRALVRADRPAGKLFVLISGETFSAAVGLATAIDQHTNALFVGTPTRGRPNAYGDIGRLTMPNSGIEVRYSRYAMNQSIPEDTRPAIFPDLVAEPTVEDFRSGRDPGLEVVRQYRPRIPLAEFLEPILAREGVAAAVRAYTTARTDRFNDIDFTPARLTDLGDALRRRGDLGAAIALLRLDAEFHPWNQYAWYYLGEALLSDNQRPEAMLALRRAFELDKRATKYRDLLTTPAAAH